MGDGKDTAFAIGAGNQATIKPFAALTTKPANTTVVVSPLAAAGYVLPEGLKPYDVTFNSDLAVAPPAALVALDKSGWKDDTVTIPKIAGITWSYQIGEGAHEPVDTSRGNVVLKVSSEDPKTGQVTIKVTADAATGYVLPDKAPVDYTLTFQTGTLVKPLAPALKVLDRATGFSTVTLPYVLGIEYEVTEYPADGTPVKEAYVVANAGKQDLVLDSATTKVAVVAKPKAAYTFGNGVDPVTSAWTFLVKTSAKEIDPPTEDALTATDLPGTAKDYVEVKGMEGVTWTYNGRALARIVHETRV